jgi:nudix-type nucleoside diphosphatase (YffH/AdpP family)
VVDIFLPPPFDSPAILTTIVGEPHRPLRSATLAGHALRADPTGLRIALAPAPSASVEGALLAATPEALSRLDFAMTALGATRHPVAARSDGTEAPAQAYRFTADTDLDAPGTESAEHLARLAETLTEIMGHYGRRPPEDMPALLHGIGVRALARSRGPATSTPVALGAGLGAAEVSAAERAFAYARYFAMEEHRLRHRRFDGGSSDLLDRAVFTSGDAVTVLPYDPRRDAVLLIEQFRAGPWARRDPRPWCLETVAGRCDRIEPPEATARREAREEAGLELGRLERIAGFYPSPAIMAEYIISFVGEADLEGAGGTHGLAEEHEDIRAVVVPLGDALAAVASGEINTAPLMLSLLWLERNAPRLREGWTRLASRG